MISVHGEGRSGKSALLRALEASPPEGHRAVYVPVPTLDFTGLAHWCLDRLGEPVGADPVASLRAVAQRSHLLVLVDDAGSLALDTALALRALERDSRGGAVVVAAMDSEERERPAVVALGAPSEVVAAQPGKAAELAAALCDRIAPRAPAPSPERGERSQSPPPATSLRPPPPPRPVRGPLAAAARAAAPAMSLAVPAPQRLAPVREPAQDPSPPPPVGLRTVPLSMALTMALAAFLVPIAFGVGFWLGHGRGPLPAATEARALPKAAAPPPDVAAAPPEMAAAVAAARPAAASKGRLSPEPTRPVGREAAPAASGARPRPAPAETPAPIAAASARPAAPVAKNEAPARTAPSAPVTTPRKETAPPAVPTASSQDAADEWGAPTLVSVEPGAP